jgi:hypothetical protein
VSDEISGLDVSIALGDGPCRDTVGGWLWYCDEHDTHGNADSYEEAEVVSAAHSEVVDPDEPCEIRIWKVEPKL